MSTKQLNVRLDANDEADLKVILDDVEKRTKTRPTPAEAARSAIREKAERIKGAI
jgi:hypothetical protein